jgi:hypothetical protein
VFCVLLGDAGRWGMVGLAGFVRGSCDGRLGLEGPDGPAESGGSPGSEDRDVPGEEQENQEDWAGAAFSVS